MVSREEEYFSKIWCEVPLLDKDQREVIVPCVIELGTHARSLALHMVMAQEAYMFGHIIQAQN